MKRRDTVLLFSLFMAVWVIFMPLNINSLNISYDKESDPFYIGGSYGR